MKQLFFTLLVALAVLIPQSMAAYDFEQNGIFYNILNGTEVEVTSYLELNDVPSLEYNGSYGGCVIIPQTINYNGVSFDVTAIGDYAFCRCSYLESVTIPTSVTRIGDYALAYNPYCDVISYADPQNTTMGNAVFYAEDYYYDRTLYVAPYIDYYYLEEMGWTQYFYNIASLFIVTEDYQYNILSRWTVEAKYVSNNDIEAASIPETIEYNDKTFCVTSIGDGLFSNCSNLKSVAIPQWVTSIGDMAFSHCSALTEITIPEYVTSIGDEAFMGCTGLTSITIPDGVTVLSDGLFRYCKGLTSVNFGYDVTSIGNSTFYGCKGLTNMLIPNTVTSIGSSAFAGCNRLKNINIPNSVTSIGSYTFLRCDSLTNVTFGKSLRSIGDYAFDGCSDLISLNIPKSVTSIGFRAFSSTYKLTSITVESGNPVYDSRDNCNAIIETSSNTLITGCGATVIPNTVAAIGDAAFFNAPYSDVRIPASVTSIGKKAFAGCWVNSVVCLATTPPAADAELFNNGSTNTSAPLSVPNGSIEAYRNAVGWNFLYNIHGLGDVDGNGELNVSDVIRLINVLTNNEPVDDNPSADYNGDGVVNITDIIHLINFISNN